jgi:hypothetical protein
MEGLGSAFINFTIEGYESLKGKYTKEEEAFAKQRTKDKRHKLRLRIKIRTTQHPQGAGWWVNHHHKGA